MKKTIFEGVGTAIVTPFTEDGIDYASFEKLIEWQIAEGVNALVVAGTTGESSTLGDEEHIDVIKFAVEKVKGRVPVIAGTGSNDTKYAIDLTKEACNVGADACLVVTPYYNKCTQKGLVNHYAKIADNSTKPIILYNVPSRTGVSFEPSTYLALADHENISAIKEANSNVAKLVETMSLIGDKLDVYSGCDELTVPMMACGAKGVISVLSNVMPNKTAQMCKKALNGDFKGAMAIQCETLKLVNCLFCETSPTPVKSALSAMGMIKNILREPLIEMQEENLQKMKQAMRELGLEV